ncbi:MAG: DUF4349 domain-containing protein, partial [Polyangiaceae bacterium]
MRHLSAYGALSALLLLNACSSGGAKYPGSAMSSMSPAPPAQEHADVAGSAAPSAAPMPSADSAMAAPSRGSEAPSRSSSSQAKTTSPAPSAPPADGRSKPPAATQAEAPQANLFLIYTGEISMLADEDALPGTIDKSIDVAESLGGFLSTRKDTSVTLRVPSAHFREAMTKMEALGIVTHRSVAAED